MPLITAMRPTTAAGILHGRCRAGARGSDSGAELRTALEESASGLRLRARFFLCFGGKVHTVAVSRHSRSARTSVLFLFAELGGELVGPPTRGCTIELAKIPTSSTEHLRLEMAEPPLRSMKTARRPSALARFLRALIWIIPETAPLVQRSLGNREPCLSVCRPVGLRGRRALPNELRRVGCPTSGHDRRWEFTRSETGPWSEAARATVGA